MTEGAGSIHVFDDTDWDTNPTSGDPYDEQNKKEYPKLYDWTCCRQKGDEEGCKHN